MQRTSPLSRLRFGMILAVGLVLIAACSGSGRPSTAGWVPTWEAAVSSMPDAATLIAQGTDGVCNDELVAIREFAKDLLPAPDEVLDDPVGEWIATAETALFDCPPAQDTDYVTTFDRLERLEAEVATVLAIDDQG